MKDNNIETHTNILTTHSEGTMRSILGTYRRSDITFRSNGLFDLTARGVKVLDIKPGDSIDVITDGREYYLYVARHATASWAGFKACVYPSNKKRGGNHFRGWSKQLCRAILELSGIEGKAALPCGEVVTDSTGRRLLPIIIRLNLI